MTTDSLSPALREYLDARFGVVDQRLQQLQHDLADVKTGQRETNGQVGKLQLWRAGLEGEVRALRAAAGGTRALVLTFVGMGTLGIGVASLLLSVLRGG